MSRKPESVRKQAEAANATIKALGNTAQGDDQPIDATAQPGDQAKPPAETPETASVSDQPKPESQTLDRPLGNDGDPWEQRYKILQGKYNKEVPALHDKVRQLTEQLRDQPSGDNQEVKRLQDEVAALKQQLESAKPQQTANNPSLDALREQYPADLVDGILAVVKGMVDPIQQRVDTVDKTVSQTSKTSNVDRLRNTLRENSIDFDQVNTDPLFVEDFLGELAPYSDKTKGQLLSEAFEKGDIGRAAKFFIDYVGERGSASGSSADRKNDLDKHVSAHSPGAGGTPSTAGHVWTEQSIAQFYEDKRRGKYTPEEAKALEADLFASMNRAG